MTTVVAYWVAAAREHHRWAADTQRQLQGCRRQHDLADLRKNHQEHLND